MSNLDSTISRMLSDYTGDAVIEPSEFDGDLSRRDTRRFMVRSLAGAAVRARRDEGDMPLAEGAPEAPADQHR